MRWLRRIAAAAAVACLPLVALGLRGLADRGSALDDAPGRAAGVLLTLSPLFFVGFLLYFGWLTLFLAERPQRPVWATLLAHACVALPLAALMGASSPWGLRDALLAAALTFGLVFTSLGLGSIGWWAVGRRPRSAPR